MPIDKAVYQSLLNIFRDELKESHQLLINALLKMETADEKTAEAELQTLFRTAHNVKGAAKSVSIDSVAVLAHQLEDQFSEWREKNYRPTKEEINRCLMLVDDLLLTFQTVTKKNTTSSEILKIPLERIEKANTKADEFIIYKLRFENWINELNHLFLLSQSKNELNKNSTQLLNEISTHLATLSEGSGQFLGEFSRSLQDLQEDLHEMRLLPIASILTPLKRVARELASGMNKNVVLETVGDDIEMDKSILDLIKDPLQHLLRNAIDHGIEASDERKRLKKPAEAMIKVAIAQDAGKINIIFSDDGRGIDIHKIKAKALKENYIAQEKLAILSDQDLLKIIMKPGFSTSEKVTDVSGRGVGLDVVQTQIEQAKGTIDINTQLNVGTAFTIQLPLTLASTRGLFVNASNNAFMLPSLSLTALYDIHLSELKSVESELVYVVNNSAVPVRFLKSLLKIKEHNDKKDNGRYCGILMSDSTNAFMILVDEIDNEHDCVIKPLPEPFNTLTLYIGVTLTGANELVPILNPKIIFELAKQYQFDASSEISALQFSSKKSAIKKHILIVDDSLTTRSLAANALRSAGFEVTTLADGRAAWNQLSKNEKQIDCVVTDIEMPYMSGYELTTLIKADAKLKKIPVVIVSAHESIDEKEKGMACGTDAYLVKSQFNTRALIDVIESLI